MKKRHSQRLGQRNSLGRIPKPGDSFSFDGLSFTVLPADNSRRVAEVRNKKPSR
ncbi:MAG: hypothetical protein ACLTSG_07840 [Lachnospiraceae bacterium]